MSAIPLASTRARAVDDARDGGDRITGAPGDGFLSNRVLFEIFPECFGAHFFLQDIIRPSGQRPLAGRERTASGLGAKGEPYANLPSFFAFNAFILSMLGIDTINF